MFVLMFSPNRMESSAWSEALHTMQVTSSGTSRNNSLAAGGS
jgi:hypothetical protein